MAFPELEPLSLPRLNEAEDDEFFLQGGRLAPMPISMSPGTGACQPGMLCPSMHLYFTGPITKPLHMARQGSPNNHPNLRRTRRARKKLHEPDLVELGTPAVLLNRPEHSFYGNQNAHH